MSGCIQRGLLADLGGTNARFAVGQISPNGEVAITQSASLRVRDYATADAALEAYLQRASGDRFDFAALACAGPVEAGRVNLTNLGWRLSECELAAALGLERVKVLNDLAAVAWAAPALGHADLRAVGAAPFRPGIIAVLGVGTGSNCAVSVPGAAEGDVVLVGEAGHAGFAPCDELEIEIWRRLNARFGRVSVERLASGPGVLNIYLALCDIAGSRPGCETPEAVSLLADGGDAIADQALDRFALVLGGVAGDCALASGARSLYVAGGVAPGLLTADRTAAFRARFEDKGRFAARMEQIGVFIIVHPHASMIGAERAANLSVRSAA